MNAPTRALIAGAGIGGLAAAIALARAGIACTLLEQAPVFEEVGAGLQLSPNATRLLQEWGVLERIRGYATTPEALRIRRARDGATLVRMPLGPVAELRWGAPHIVIHRADLHRALLENAARQPGIVLESGVTVLGFAASSGGVEVAGRRDGRSLRFEADLLVGADGLRSVVRSKLGLGNADQPIWSGRTAWRALVDAEAAPGHALRLETNLWLGTNAHLVHYPLRGGTIVNVVAITQDSWRGDDAVDFWSTPGRAEDVTQRFSGWHVDARRLVAAASAWQRWPLFDRNTPPFWSSGRVTLLGDAAHPMMPFLAQGVCQAVEDAEALTACLQAGPDIASALKAYERERMPRTAAVQLASRRQGGIYHMSGPIAFGRDLAMRSLGFERLMDRMDWIYHYSRHGGGTPRTDSRVASAT